MNIELQGRLAKQAYDSLRAVVPNPGRIRMSARVAMTEYAIERAIKAYRERAKEDRGSRRHYLREAWRLRSVLRTGFTFRYHVEGSGQSFTLVPHVPMDSDLQYTYEDARN